MNFVEQHTWNHLSDHITRLDPDRQGLCVDVGLGDGDYYFEWFAGLGYDTIAIEPLPTEGALRAVEASRASLVQAALGDRVGEAKLFTARNIHSLYDGLWGEAENSHTVPMLTWQNVLETDDRVTALKLDIEGAENMVIRQLWSRPLPAVLSFEFGGVWQRNTGRGPWSMERVASLLHSLRTLHGLGYRHGVVIASGNTDSILFITLERRMDIDALFSPDCGWGNIVVWRET